MRPYITLQCQLDFNDTAIYGAFSQPRAKNMPLLVVVFRFFSTSLPAALLGGAAPLLLIGPFFL